MLSKLELHNSQTMERLHKSTHAVESIAKYCLNVSFNSSFNFYIWLRQSSKPIHMYAVRIGDAVFSVHRQAIIDSMKMLGDKYYS